MHTSPARKETRSVSILVYIGLLIVLFAFGKSVIDLVVSPPRVLDLAADDQISEGFLPVYAVEGKQANPSAVAVEGQPTAEAFPTPLPGAAPLPTEVPGEVPDRIAIPAIDLEAPVVPVDYLEVTFEGQIYEQWLAPDYRAAGWHNTSAGLGVPGNTVLNGHNNIKGEVFRDLYRVQQGDEIDVFSGGKEFKYLVVFTAILPERNQPLEVRLANAEWIEPTEDERITLITCWPYESNTHRVIVVAVPIRNGEDG